MEAFETNNAFVIVAARASLAESSTVADGRRIPHNPYKEKGKWVEPKSRVLVAQPKWRHKMHGQDATQFAMVHFHRKPAKRDPASLTKSMCNAFHFSSMVRDNR